MEQRSVTLEIELPWESSENALFEVTMKKENDSSTCVKLSVFYEFRTIFHDVLFYDIEWERSLNLTVEELGEYIMIHMFRPDDNKFIQVRAQHDKPGIIIDIVDGKEDGEAEEVCLLNEEDFNEKKKFKMTREALDELICHGYAEVVDTRRTKDGECKLWRLVGDTLVVETPHGEFLDEEEDAKLEHPYFFNK